MVTEVISHHYGRGGELKRLNADRNDITLPRSRRLAADKAHQKIMKQLSDRTLMGMRERLIRASRAGDEREIAQITRQMRAYLKEDQETGLYA